MTSAASPDAPRPEASLWSKDLTGGGSGGSGGDGMAEDQQTTSEIQNQRRTDVPSPKTPPPVIPSQALVCHLPPEPTDDPVEMTMEEKETLVVEQQQREQLRQEEAEEQEQEEAGEMPKVPLTTTPTDGILPDRDDDDSSSDNSTDGEESEEEEEEEEEEASCDLSADTLPMTGADEQAGAEEAEDLQRALLLSSGSSRDNSSSDNSSNQQSFSEYERPEAEAVTRAVTELLSPDTKTVHQALVAGYSCQAAAFVEDDSNNSAAAAAAAAAAAGRRPSDATSVSADTDDGLGREITNLNSYEDETRWEVENTSTVAPSKAEEDVGEAITASAAGDATPTKETDALPTTAPADVDPVVQKQQQQENGSNRSVVVGDAGSSAALERLQQQVGAMARATLMGDSDNDDDNSDFVPLGSEQKRISFLSDADDGMGRELSHLQEAEDETRREVEDAVISAPATEVVDAPTCPSSVGLLVESDGPAGPIPQGLLENDVTGGVSNAIELEDSSPVSPSPVLPRRVDDVPGVGLTVPPAAAAAAPLISDSKLSFQECIEKQRWDAVRQHLDTDNGKVARRDVYITSNVSLEDDHDDMDYVELLDSSGRSSSGSGRDTRYRRKATALHLACIHDPPLDVVRSLIRAHPEGVSTPTHLGWEYPLHYAVGSGMSSDEILLTLVETFPDAVSTVSTAAGRYGPHKSPLHLAVSSLGDSDDVGPSPLVLRAMCRHNPTARSVRDGSGRTPLELAKTCHNDCPQVVMKILSPSNQANELITFRAKSFLAAVAVVVSAVLLRKLEKAVNLFLGRVTILVSMGSDGLAVAACICIIALLIVNTTRIIQQDKTAQRSMRGQDETGHASDELVTILYVSAVGLIVLFATEPVTLLLHTTVVTGCAVGYILLRRSRQGPVDDTDAEFSDCREGTTHRSMSDSSLKDYSSTRQYDMTPLERDGMCIVCWDRPADHVLVPCGHLCLCAECPRRLGEDLNWQCPIGKCAVHAAMKVYPAQISDTADETVVATQSTTTTLTTTNEEEE